MYINVNTKKGVWFKPTTSGESVEGVLTEIRCREGLYGRQSFLVLDDGGEVKYVSLTAGLAVITFELLLKKRIKLVYKGMTTNIRTMRSFKDFDVLVYHSDDLSPL